MQIRWVSEDGSTHSESHTKHLVIDDVWAYVGSQNMDRQSWGFSRELGVGIDNPSAVQQLADEAFDTPWERGIPLRPSLGAQLLLPPTGSFAHRCSRYLLPPLAVVERAVEAVKRWFHPDYWFDH